MTIWKKMLTMMLRTETPALLSFFFQNAISIGNRVSPSPSLSHYRILLTVLESEHFKETVEKADRDCHCQENGVGFQEHSFDFIGFRGRHAAHRTCRGLLSIHHFTHRGVNVKLHHGKGLQMDGQRQGA